MCRSVNFPPSFGSFYWGMLIYFLSWNLSDVVHSCLTFCVGCICCFCFFPIWAFMSPSITRTLCFGILRTREYSPSWKAMSSVSSLTLVGLLQEVIVTLGLSLKVATVILGCILSMLLSDFKALGPISIPTSPTMALTEFFHAYTVTSVHPLSVS